MKHLGICPISSPPSPLLSTPPLTGQSLTWASSPPQALQPNTLLLDNALATMGAGLPSAMAVSLLFPEKKVVAVCGDGGFMMNSQVGKAGEVHECNEN